jgi:phosphatidylserine decarboxylase
MTNRIPRRLATQFAGWFSRIESRLLTRLSLALWQRLGGDLRLHEAESRDFVSVHACFTRRLRPGARPVAAAGDILVSPCDAIVGASGRIEAGTLLQAKGLSYRLDELLGDRALAERHHGGWFVTLRLRSTMYHRFHAPCDGRLSRVRYITGDTWNVNPIAVRRIERLFCRNGRAVLDFELHDRRCRLTLVPVAAILVASVRLHALPHALTLHEAGGREIACTHDAVKAEELGYFENGSTIIVLASGPMTLEPSVREGTMIRMGEPLLRSAGIALSLPPRVTAAPVPTHVAPPQRTAAVALQGGLGRLWQRLREAATTPPDYPPHFPREDYHA